MTEGQQSFSPSAFIPFCSFRPTFLDGQLCYKLNANELKNKVDKKEIASQGVVMLLDYNLDRMVKHKEENTSTVEESSIMKKNKENTDDAMIYIETLGNNNFLK